MHQSITNHHYINRVARAIYQYGCNAFLTVKAQHLMIFSSTICVEHFCDYTQVNSYFQKLSQNVFFCSWMFYLSYSGSLLLVRMKNTLR
jgi:hypothetical protein